MLLTLFLAVMTHMVAAQEKIILLDEGNWQADNGRISYFEDGKVVSNKWFRDNNGYKLGDTPNDIIQINDNLIAIAINWSNIVQFITPGARPWPPRRTCPTTASLLPTAAMSTSRHTVMNVAPLTA